MNFNPSEQHYSHREVLVLALPMILSGLSVPLLGAVDTAVMGHLDSEHYLASVAIGAIVFSFIYMGMNFLRMGTTGLVAQAFGKNDYTETRTILGQALIVALTLACFLLLLQKPISHTLEWLQASERVTLTAYEYFAWRIWSAPFVLCNFVLIGWFLGMQNARGPMLMLLVTNGVNIILDIYFVVSLEMTVAGVALASVIAEFVGFIAGSLYLLSVLNQYEGQWIKQQILALKKLQRFFTVNSHILIRTFSLMFSFAFFTAQGAKFGDKILAANAVLLNFQTFMAYGLDGFANAAEALTGRAIGEKNKQGLKLAIKRCFQWAFALSLVMSLTYLLFGKTLVGLLTDLPDIRDIADEYLLWLVVSPIVSVWCFIYDGIFIGATKSFAMMKNMLLATFLIFIPSCLLLTQQFGNHGLWLAFLLFLTARAVFLHLDRKKILSAI